FTYTVTDANGNTTTGTILVDIIDDVPVAFANTNSVDEGATVNGNVLIDGTDDVFGADGPAGAGVTGVATGSNTATPVSGNLGGAGIAGAYGTLTLNADGSYSYEADPNVVVSGSVVDHFVYTITDGDGDTSTTTLDITIGDVTVTASDTDALVNEAGLPSGSNPGASSEVFNGSITPAGGTGPYSYTLTSSANGAYGNLVLDPNTGTYTYTLDTAYDGVTADNATNTEQDRDSFTYTVTDANGNTTTGTILVDIIDDVPTLGTVQDQQTDNNPATAPAVGTLHYTAGADGTGSVIITADTSSIAVGGDPVVTVQSGNVLTAYVDSDSSGTFNAGDTTVFTLTVDPTAGTSGQYTFNLVTELDPVVTDVPIGSGSSFGSGPSDSIIVQEDKTDPTSQQLVYVTGWEPNPGWDEAGWLEGDMPSLTQRSDINGSTQGWGLQNNNLDSPEFMRFDFGGLNDYDEGTEYDPIEAGDGIYEPPAGTDIANVTYATFSFFNFGVGDTIEFVAHYTDGSTETWVLSDGEVSTLTISAAGGLEIGWIDVYQSAGSIKLNLTNVGVASSNIDETIPFTLEFVDGDGDTTATQNFTVHVADGLAPFIPAAPVAIDLNGDGVEYLSLTAGVTYDYGWGEVQTAWVAPDDGLLARAIGESYDIVFADDALGAATDLEGLRLAYDSIDGGGNGDGKFTAADTAFAEFGVWQDSNSNGVVDAGEFTSLTDMGITSIDLVSDGQAHMAANGDVLVYGEATYTMNGTTGTIADAAFATSAVGGTTTTQETEKTLVNTGLNQALLAASLITAVDYAQAETPPATDDSSTTNLSLDGDASGQQSAPAEADIAPADTTETPETLLSGDEQQEALPPETDLSDSDVTSDSGSGIGDVTTDDSGADLGSQADSSDQSTGAGDAHPVTVDAMPVFAAIVVADAQSADPQPTGDALPIILADALGGGAGDGPNIDALLDALPQTAPDAGIDLSAAAAAMDQALHLAGSGFNFDLAMMSHDVVAAAHAA
ncbi:beta strand repeat-containing protein, partial [Rhizorhapis sp. SPR117]|uniref:beta strand repeat-containing protein n=1 Tax=Rhizorhapis sp. SPR117 TaxID=2912611 RepID=UPI001F19DB99|nr:VCBS domain-containing protein [Rhizorhapis sp. SPR117]